MGPDPPGRYLAAVIGVSIVLYRSAYSPLLATLRSIQAQTLPADGVVITVNAAHGEEVELRDRLSIELPAWQPKFVFNEGNVGFSAAHNSALEMLFANGCAAGLVLNPDVVLADDCLHRLQDAATAARVALLGPVLELADPRTLRPTGLLDTAGVRWTWDGRHFDAGQGGDVTPESAPISTVDAISGACLLVMADAFRSIKDLTGEFFDEDFIAYREDAELGFRARLAGVESLVVPSARGLHVRQLRGTSRGADPHIDRLGVRNRFLIAFKYGRHRPGRWPWPYFRDLVVVLGVLLRERSSWPGVVEAWQLRHAMRAKRRRLRPLLKAQH